MTSLVYKRRKKNVEKSIIEGYENAIIIAVHTKTAGRFRFCSFAVMSRRETFSSRHFKRERFAHSPLTRKFLEANSF